MKKDLAAVRAGLTEEWSNGPVEGFVHKLKLLKRQGYGRAGFDLLKGEDAGRIKNYRRTDLGGDAPLHQEADRAQTLWL